MLVREKALAVLREQHRLNLELASKNTAGNPLSCAFCLQQLAREYELIRACYLVKSLFIMALPLFKLRCGGGTVKKL